MEPNAPDWKMGKLPHPARSPANRPGGGLGPPIDAPDPLQKYRWWILGGFAAVLLIGGVYVASRQQSAARAVRLQSRTGTPGQDAEEEDDYESAGYCVLQIALHPQAHDAFRLPC
jgi:hypothetical protein